MRTWHAAVMAGLLFFAHAWIYSFLCDDAYISFRYARNLIEGHGLVFNPGERVEGITNLLWTLQLAALWWGAGLDPEITAVPLGYLSAAVAFALLGALARTSPFGTAALPLVLFGAAIHRSLAVWTTSGLEQRQVTALQLLAVLAIHRGLTRDRAAWILVAAFASALALIARPEPLLMPLGVALWIIVESRRRQRPAVGPLTLYLLPTLGAALALFAFRLHYYGVPLPNTYYAKGRDLWLSAGLAYFAQVTLEHGWWLLLPLAVVGARARHRAGDTLHLLGAWVVLPPLLFLLKNGGDHFEYRALDVAFCLLLLAAVDGALVLRRRLPAPVATVGAIYLVAYTTFLPTLDLAVNASVDRQRPQLAHHRPLSPYAAPLQLLLPGAFPIAATYDLLRLWSAPHFVATRHLEHQAFRNSQRARWAPYTQVARADFPPGLVSSRGAMGVIPYLLADVRWIDRYGLTDATVARLPDDPDGPRRVAHPWKNQTLLRRYIDSRVNVYLHPPERSAEAVVAQGRVAVRLGPDLWMAITPRRPKLRSIFGDRELYAPIPRDEPDVPVLAAGQVWRRHRRVLRHRSIRLATGEALLLTTPAGGAGARLVDGDEVLMELRPSSRERRTVAHVADRPRTVRVVVEGEGPSPRAYVLADASPPPR